MNLPITLKFMNSTPGSRLKAARKKLGHTQQGVANHISQSVHTYKKWEQDKAQPRTPEITKRTCDYLGITVGHYKYGEENTFLSVEHQTLIDLYENASPEIKQAVRWILEREKT
jgi:transcriptional regulator with XRE-family HTH domain